MIPIVKVNKSFPVSLKSRKTIWEILIGLFKSLIQASKLVVVNSENEVRKYYPEWDGEPDWSLDVPGETLTFYIVILVTIPFFPNFALVILVH